MKKCFVPKSFNPEALRLIGIINKIMTDYDKKGFRMSLRQLYYQLVKGNIIENTVKEYKRIGGIVSDARLAGLLDMDIIEDRGRVTKHPGGFDNPAQFVEHMAHRYTIDAWRFQTNHVEVMVEKEALAGIFGPVCAQERVCFTANKGYISTSLGYEVGCRIASAYKGCEATDTRGKDIHIIYLGDHDPSGVQMTDDVKERLEMFSGVKVEVHRIALNMDQIQLYQPPHNPAKEKDSRYESYVERFKTTSSWELDALSPDVLASLCRAKIRELRDDYFWNYAMEMEKHHQQKIKKFAEIAAKAFKS